MATATGVLFLSNNDEQFGDTCIINRITQSASKITHAYFAYIYMYMCIYT